MLRMAFLLVGVKASDDEKARFMPNENATTSRERQDRVELTGGSSIPHANRPQSHSANPIPLVRCGQATLHSYIRKLMLSSDEFMELLKEC